MKIMKKCDLVEENRMLKRDVERLQKVLKELLEDIEKAPTIVQFDRDKLQRKLLSNIDPIPF